MLHSHFDGAPKIIKIILHDAIIFTKLCQGNVDEDKKAGYIINTQNTNNKFKNENE